MATVAHCECILGQIKSLPFKLGQNALVLHPCCIDVTLVLHWCCIGRQRPGGQRLGGQRPAVCVPPP